MTETPEWFEITSEDHKPAAPKAKRRLLKVALFTAPLLVVGGAMVFAQGGDEEGAASKLSINTDFNSNQNAGQNLNQNGNGQLAPGNNSGNSNGGVAAPVAPNSNGGIQAPGNGPLANDPDHGAGTDRPQNFGDDDHEGFQAGGEREHQRDGEREGSGSAPKIPSTTSGTSTTKN